MQSWSPSFFPARASTFHRPIPFPRGLPRLNRSELQVVCRVFAPVCVDSERLRVYRQHAPKCLSMRTCCQYTRGRFESTHRGAFNRHTAPLPKSFEFSSHVHHHSMSQHFFLNQTNFKITENTDTHTYTRAYTLTTLTITFGCK